MDNSKNGIYITLYEQFAWSFIGIFFKTDENSTNFIAHWITSMNAFEDIRTEEGRYTFRILLFS